MGLNPESFTQFKISKPWGYYVKEVEKAIAEYESTISAVNAKFEEKQLKCLKLEETINILQEELRDMHLQLSSLELPDSTEMVESVVLNDFKNYNNSESFGNNYEPEVVQNNFKDESKKSNENLPFTIAK